MRNNIAKNELFRNLQVAIKNAKKARLPGLKLIKEIQEPIETLILVLQQVFRHGLKPKLLGIFNSRHSFWSFVCEISAHDVRAQIENLDCLFFRTLAGKEIAWIILALNDNLIGTYFNIARTNPILTK